ncbi:MAG: ABC transporter substrate-binding protein [Phycisphaerae bacterium]
MLLTAGCDRASPSPVPAGADADTPGVRVVSLSPTATDLLVAMGAGGSLVGVSNYDTDAAVADLPRVGDYQTIDWSAVLRLAPAVIFVHAAPDRLPPGLSAKAQQVGATVHALKVDRLADVYAAAEAVGRAAGVPEAGRDLARRLQAEIQAVEADAPLEPVPTLLVTSPDGTHVIGRETAFDDLLQAAGGTNVLGESETGYLTIRPERILALDPVRVIVLLPGAGEQTLADARRFWNDRLPGFGGRVTIITDEKALTVGSHVGPLARQFAGALK